MYQPLEEKNEEIRGKVQTVLCFWMFLEFLFCLQGSIYERTDDDGPEICQAGDHADREAVEERFEEENEASRGQVQRHLFWCFCNLYSVCRVLSMEKMTPRDVSGILFIGIKTIISLRPLPM